MKSKFAFVIFYFLEGSFRLKSHIMLRGIMTCSRGKAGKLFFFVIEGSAVTQNGTDFTFSHL